MSHKAHIAALALRLIRKVPRKYKYVAACCNHRVFVGCWLVYIYIYILFLLWLAQVQSTLVWWYRMIAIEYSDHSHPGCNSLISEEHAAGSIISQHRTGVRSTGDPTGHPWTDAGALCQWLYPLLMLYYMVLSLYYNSIFIHYRSVYRYIW